MTCRYLAARYLGSGDEGENEINRILASARLVRFIFKRNDVYYCFEKGEEHYVMRINFGIIEIGNGLLVMLFGPDCEHSEAIENREWPLDDDWYWKAISAGVIEVARECWGEKE